MLSTPPPLTMEQIPPRLLGPPCFSSLSEDQNEFSPLVCFYSSPGGDGGPGFLWGPVFPLDPGPSGAGAGVGNSLVVPHSFSSGPLPLYSSSSLAPEVSHEAHPHFLKKEKTPSLHFPHRTHQ